MRNYEFQYHHSAVGGGLSQSSGGEAGDGQKQSVEHGLAEFERFLTSSAETKIEVTQQTPHAQFLWWNTAKGFGKARLAGMPEGSEFENGTEVFVHASALRSAFGQVSRDLQGEKIFPPKNGGQWARDNRRGPALSDARSQEQWEKDEGETHKLEVWKRWLTEAALERVRDSGQKVRFLFLDESMKQLADRLLKEDLVVNEVIFDKTIGQWMKPPRALLQAMNERPDFYGGTKSRHFSVVCDPDNTTLFKVLFHAIESAGVSTAGYSFEWHRVRMTVGNSDEVKTHNLRKLAKLHRESASALSNGEFMEGALYVDGDGRRLMVVSPDEYPLLQDRGNTNRRVKGLLMDVDTGEVVRELVGTWKVWNVSGTDFGREEVSSGVDRIFAIPDDLMISLAPIGLWDAMMTEKGIRAGVAEELLQETDYINQYSVQITLGDEAQLLEAFSQSADKSTDQQYEVMWQKVQDVARQYVFSSFVNDYIENNETLALLDGDTLRKDVQLAAWYKLKGIESDPQRGRVYGLKVEHAVGLSAKIVPEESVGFVKSEDDRYWIFEPTGDQFDATFSIWVKPDYVSGSFEWDTKLIPTEKLIMPKLVMTDECRLVWYSKSGRKSRITLPVLLNPDGSFQAYYDEKERCWLTSEPDGYTPTDEQAYYFGADGFEMLLRQIKGER